jgi:hypothetical protein
VDWIQAKKSHEPGQPIINVKVVAVQDNGHVDIEGDELSLTLWHHDADRLRPALRLGGEAEWKPRFHVLYVVSVGSFSLAGLNEVEPCVPPIRRRPTETTRQYIERAMRVNHGYTVPEHWLVDLDAIPDGDIGERQSGYLVGNNNPSPKEKALLRKLSEEFGGRSSATDAEYIERDRRGHHPD